MVIFDILKKNAIKYPYKEAIIFDDIKLNYTELLNSVIKTILVLEKNKITNKNKVAIIEDNTISYILSLFSLSYLGVEIIPLNTHYSNDIIQKIFEKHKVDVLISNTKYANFLSNKFSLKKIITTNKSKNFTYFYDYSFLKKKKLKKKKLNSKKNFLILFSSGSTGNPKPIVFTQKNKILRSKLMRDLYKISEEDKVILTCPIDHSLGMRLLFLPLLTGGTCVVMSKFTTEKYFKVVKKNNVTFSILISSQIYELLKRKKKFKKFYLKKGLVSASSKLSNHTKKIILKNKINLFEMYGASEIGTVTSINVNKDSKKMKSVGKSYNKNISIRILSNKNKFLKNNETGQIVCRTPTIFKEYLGLNELTKNSFFKGFFKTGDIGYLDNNKYLYFLGRQKNIIRRSGITIYPEDIENILINDKNINEVAAIGINRNENEEICLFVKKNNKITYDYVKKICIKKLSVFQIPNKIYLIDNFPKTSIGKINKKLLLSFL